MCECNIYMPTLYYFYVTGTFQESQTLSHKNFYCFKIVIHKLSVSWLLFHLIILY